ncbi:cytosolic factor, phosphatidylinositol/phosphatidylcholine transfer protein [Geranomyces variabilis]|nr:cytosolic factor, phosphatidylinositol/phosphatidylcholine transfer protein [Geranomyces variabilis]
MSAQASQENLAGRLGHLTAEQEAVLAQFKTELAAEGFYDPEKHDDHALLRFLRARKFQLPASKKMWSEYVTWRKDFGTDNVLETFEFPEYPIVKKFYPRFYHKADKLGRPVYFEQLGGVDVKQLFAVTDIDRMLKNHVYEYEKLVKYRLPACSKKAGRYVEQSCTILDLKNVYLTSFPSVAGLIRQISVIAQNYYPEMLGKMYIINAPMLFSGIWSVVKGFLDEVTVNKISIASGSNKAELLKMIDAASLPKAYGGTCECPGGCANADLGPWNDGTVEGYPQELMEKFNKLYGPAAAGGAAAGAK